MKLIRLVLKFNSTNGKVNCSSAQNWTGETQKLLILVFKFVSRIDEIDCFSGLTGEKKLLN